MSRLSVLFDSELSTRAVCVYLILDEYADKDGYCFPSLKPSPKGVVYPKVPFKERSMI